MTDDMEAPQEQEPQAPEAPATPESDAATVGPKEIEEGKVLAILSYIIPVLCVVPLIMRNNSFSLYHAKQCLLLFIAFVVSSLVNAIPCFGQIVWLVAWVFLVVLDVMGLINAIKGELKPVPLVGNWAEDWFKGIHKV